jgi:hypothetical protein
MAQFTDQYGQRFSLDTSLQVVIDGHVGYIEGNAHTHRGRMHIYFPHLGYDLTHSVDEIDSMSEAARWWIQGFLVGSEPNIFEYLGIDDIPEDETPEPTATDYDRWRRFNSRCRAAGQWPVLNKRPHTPLTITADEREELRIAGKLQPWAKAGEQVWVPDGETWSPADPQPELLNGQMPGSICAERGRPDQFWLESGWGICLDCGEVMPP